MINKELYNDIDNPIKIRMPIIKFKAYDLIEKAVEQGIASGWNRAHKYEDSPSEGRIHEDIGHYVMLALEEIIDFSEDCIYE